MYVNIKKAISLLIPDHTVVSCRDSTRCFVTSVVSSLPAFMGIWIIRPVLLIHFLSVVHRSIASDVANGIIRAGVLSRGSVRMGSASWRIICLPARLREDARRQRGLERLRGIEIATRCIVRRNAKMG
jgi:hypothetical protein